MNRSFRKVGITLAINGSEDCDIAIEDQENYTVNELDTDSDNPFDDDDDSVENV